MFLSKSVPIYFRKRSILYFFVDNLILLTLIFYKKNLYQDLSSISFFKVFLFCTFWLVLNYVFGVYSSKSNPLLKSIKRSIKNKSKLLITLLLYLINSSFKDRVF